MNNADPANEEWWQAAVKLLAKVVMNRRAGPAVRLALLISLPLATLVLVVGLISQPLVELAVLVARNPEVLTGAGLVLLGLSTGAVKAACWSAGRIRRRARITATRRCGGGPEQDRVP